MWFLCWLGRLIGEKLLCTFFSGLSETFVDVCTIFGGILETFMNGAVKDAGFGRNLVCIILDFKSSIIDCLLNTSLTLDSLADGFGLCAILGRFVVTGIGDWRFLVGVFVGLVVGMKVV